VACLEQSLLEHLASQIRLEVPQLQALVLAICLDQVRTHLLLASLSNQPHLALALASQQLQEQVLVSSHSEKGSNEFVKSYYLCGIRLNRVVFL
jgi:hypothetical protein